MTVFILYDESDDDLRRAYPILGVFTTLEKARASVDVVADGDIDDLVIYEEGLDETDKSRTEPKRHLLREGMEQEKEPLPEYGDHMTLAEFIENVESGMFIDYDGYGNYASETEMFSNLTVNPSDVEDGKIDKKHTHVVWFNR